MHSRKNSINYNYQNLVINQTDSAEKALVIDMDGTQQFSMEKL